MVIVQGSKKNQASNDGGKWWWDGEKEMGCADIKQVKLTTYLLVGFRGRGRRKITMTSEFPA